MTHSRSLMYRSLMLALSLLASGVVQAQGPPQRERERERERENNQREQQRQRRDQRNHHEQRDYRDERGERGQPRWRDGRGGWDSRGAGPDHSFHRGDRLPSYYRSRTFVVEDWRGHRLSSPPRGYHWVQTGSDYLLVAIATGVILQLILSQ
ncbi:RcnB family protein [Paucibacter sp. JuS9]|uniref:RcnB family protein n=1 Tax=Paucibacter sp. JuS9 TaxID=3228748 RepID=UPI0037581E90